MEKFTIFIGACVTAAMAIFMFIICGTLLGAIAGWIVGLFFGDTILGIIAQLHITNISMWQFGAFMGFVGGFLKTKVTAEVKPAAAK